ncbi:MAG: hypothetical protein A3F31_02145 [Candidatus Levybacteria bacterium RIFCSPHIGHO2_12_FULL_38_12]|nr:MAG: hypothetical protein A2770_03065 [Candidatus Levybacteria bacterium RIFCSPHIGHO2_01_FULL_38_12]OGH22786.1 MAG: hypothetical protein A3F31_02145 [Candidatus Levybacteria bacterium RIFCSPHIGHO2_12_FULL_38_12]OGH33993.1 MAG: hypothetical protein A3A47_00360 [Candidatus Levybacteria bacterium RIFCSPLOWO2_01_FULL_37_20]OGH44795.1 MAG: hypothetical protein A3J14_04600 [Candidatus Levybacteria bacterium RIFCSPLOWO2_02_FULL_37_18]
MNCSFCQSQVLDTFYFCPFCGKVLKDKPLSTTFLKQAGVYAFAFFFPPFGIIPAFKYLKQNSEQARIVGLITVLITVFSLLFAVWLSSEFIEIVSTTINAQFPKDLNLYP